MLPKLDRTPVVVSSEVVDDVLEKLTGGKSSEEIKVDIKKGKWPFAISTDQMRADLEEMDLLIPTEDEKTDQA